MDWLPHLRAPRSPLMALPAELRAQIFAHALTSPLPTVTFRLDAYQRDSYTEAVPPALCRVSRQLRHEALPLWYDSNVVVLHTEGSKGEDARRWLRRFESHLGMLKRVEVWVRYVTTAAAMMLDRSLSQGVIAVQLQRWVARDEGRWSVEGWGWRTVVRRPAGVEGDARVLMRALSTAFEDKYPAELCRVDGLMRLLAGLKAWYTKQKETPVLRTDEINFGIL